MPRVNKNVPQRCFHVILETSEGILESSKIKRISPWYYAELIDCVNPKMCLALLKKDPTFQNPPLRLQSGSSPRTPNAQEPARNSEKEAILLRLFAIVERITKRLEKDARELGSLGQDEVFPENRSRELREKIAGGMFDWAVRRMGADLQRYLDEGANYFIDQFIWNHARFDPAGRTHYERFWEPFDKTNFYIPLKPGRRAVHHSLWPEAYEIYKNARPVFQQIKKNARGNKKIYLIAIKENFAGVTDDEAAKLWRMKKDSDRALEYARWKLKLPVGVEALKEYFKVFHQPYGYIEFMASNLIRQK